MIDRETIQSVKAVDMNIILNEFGWEKDKYNKIRCPHPDHNDSTPSCAFSTSKNTCKCFGCGKAFDTIDLYQNLSEKVNGRAVPFYKAVKEILELDAMENGSTGSPVISYKGHNSCQNSTRKNGDGSPYDIIISNSRPLTGYELNYLHGRGIMIYDAYVYGGEVHTVQSIDKILQTETDIQEINRMNEIKSNGTFYKGIAPVLKANKIAIMHNYWGVNSIVYVIDYNADEEDDLCCEQFFADTRRHMAIKKTLDKDHEKRAIGTSDFNFITRGFEHNKNKDIYICEGLEDAFTYAMNGFRSISLNSTSNLKSLMDYLANDYVPCYKDRFLISFDHDERGEMAAQEMKEFFEDYNRNTCNRYKYSYAICHYPDRFKDINDYWVSKVFG